MEGWIKLHRKIIEWEWFKTSNMVHIFTYMLCKANHESRKWQGVEINRGQFISGLQAMKKETGISVQSLRTCIKRLKSTHEITIKSTNKYSIITINNYDNYNLILEHTNNQNNNPVNKELTSNQQATNIKQELKNDKNVKNKYTFSSFYDKEIEDNKDKPEIENYKLFVKFLFGENEMNKRMDCWLNLRDQISYIELQKLRDKATEKKRKLRDMIISGYNNPKRYLRGNVSFYATLNSWLNR